ncbi:MAG: hypothetical protein PHY54_20940 [Methylococcales bacterium]|nr:hypothetical protein [Methylococcales bacterium]
MANKITPHLITLTYAALLNSFWRKESLKKFLRACHISESHLSSFSLDESKREFLDRTFPALQKSDKGQALIYQLAINLAEQTSFPDLLNHENSLEMLTRAKSSVYELKNYLAKQNEEIKSEQEKEAIKNRAREEKTKIQRAQTDKVKLEERLQSLHPKLGTQQAGYEFQDWFFDLLDFAEITNRRPYVSNGRQIDGSLTLEGTTYLVELKFTKSQSDSTDIDSLKAKVESKADNTMGVMLSITGYSSVAISEASGKKTPLLLLDASHIYLFLVGSMKFDEILLRIRRHASQTGESFLPANKFGG